MKRFFVSFAISAMMIALLPSFAASAKAQPKMNYVEASSLTMVGKLFPNTPVPYHRVDTCIFKGFTPKENAQVRQASGVQIAFRTDSRRITLVPQYGENNISYSNNAAGVSTRGYDLYIKKDGQWKWAASGCPKTQGQENGVEIILADHMEDGMKDFLLYLPTFSELTGLQIGVYEGKTIEAAPMPFKYRVGVFGSSFTHGASTSRGGLTWPAFLTRMTDIQLLSLGCSGNSKLQSYFAEALAAADVDAYVFDAFSNPSNEQIYERLFKFIEIIQAKHPDVPMIFLKSIWRENRRVNQAVEKREASRMAVVDELMAKACKKYKNVYYVETTCTVDGFYEATVDGTHPDNYGYYLWAKSVSAPVCEILAKYGIETPASKALIKAAKTTKKR